MLLLKHYRLESVMVIQQGFFAGTRAALPIVLGYVPIGFAYGVLAKTSGLTVAEVVLMSIVVYAGSSQFIGSKMIGAGDPLGAIISTAFLVNLRHLLMSAALVPSMRHVPSWKSALLSYELTDESFAVISATLQGRPADPRWVAGLQMTSQLSWVLTSALGALTGGLIGNNPAFGLDFALPAMFIGLLLLQIGNSGNESRKKVAVALAAAVVSVLVAYLIPGRWNVMIATMIAASVGVMLQ